MKIFYVNKTNMEFIVQWPISKTMTSFVKGYIIQYSKKNSLRLTLFCLKYYNNKSLVVMKSIRKKGFL